MEYNNDEFVLKTIKREIKEKGILLVVGIFLALTFLVLFVAEPATPDDESARFFIAGFFLLFAVVFGRVFLQANKNNSNALNIKNNGRQYKGRVINARKRIVRSSKRNSSKVYTDILVEFKEGVDTNYISVVFPYELKLKGEFSLFDPVTKEDEITEETYIRRSQYISKGYVTYDNHDNLGRGFIYEGSKVKNYLLDNDLECTVFELDGKYVVDDYRGYDKNKAMSHEFMNKVFPAIFFMIIVIMILFAKMNG